MHWFCCPQPITKSVLDNKNVQNDDPEDSDSSVDSLDRLIQDMDYELLDTPKEERIYSKKKKIKKIKAKSITIDENKTSSIEPTIKDQTNVNDKPELLQINDSKVKADIDVDNSNKVAKCDNMDNVNGAKIETIGSRIPTLGKVIPVNILNTNNIMPKQMDPFPTHPVLKRSRSRSWSRESIPYRRTRFSRSPEHRSIFPDLTNVQLSPRALAFVYNNTGILIKRRDRRSSSSSIRDYSSDSSSRSRRSISPYPRSFKDISPQPSHSGQMHNFKPIRRSRSKSRSKSRSGVCRQRFSNKPPTARVTRRPEFREDGKKASSKKEPIPYSRRRQRSCSISLSPSPEPVTKHPMNFGRVNYTNFKPRNRTSKFNSKQNNSMNNYSNKTVNTQKNDKSNEGNGKTVIKDNTNIKNLGADSAITNPKDLALELNKDEENLLNSAIDASEDAIELALDTSLEDGWSTESSDAEREGRFKTSNKNTVQASNTKISYSAKNATRPPCLSLEEIINKDKPNRSSQDDKKRSRDGRLYRDNWDKRNRSGRRQPVSRDDRYKNCRYATKYDKSNFDSKLTNTLITNDSSEKKSTKELVEISDDKRSEISLKKIDLPLKKPEPQIKKIDVSRKIEVSMKKVDAPMKKIDDLAKKVDPTKKIEPPGKTVISLRTKPELKEMDQKSVSTLDKKFTDALKKNNELKNDEDLRDTLQQRRVKQSVALKSHSSSSSSRLVQSALLGAVASRTDLKQNTCKSQYFLFNV